ncbi:HAD-IA family hydrolase [Chloroflexia bacterium SDU3-3]|nr:HAD-IA family hydrolase [Chloroflexia bacterium SDU3-3]
MIRALIFDFDGLIFDTETIDFETWGAIYASHGQVLDHAQWIVGVGTRGAFDAAVELSQRLGGQPSAEELRELFVGRYRTASLAAPLRPGVVALLQQGRDMGLPMVIASSSDRGWVDGWLAHHEISHFFQGFRGREDVAHVKPAPDLYLSASAMLGVPPAECLVFEDSPNGMRAAAAAGMRCVAVPIPVNAGVALPPVALRLGTLADMPLAEILARVDPAEAPAIIGQK